ncbi:MAG TPA: hydroxysqualene dehydroxylase HpnE [Acidimicrobiales bacterium]|jgi:squalene-associated FAD-dependent desaturase
MTKRVVIVGGGLAGASAAFTLADAGLAVTLLERRGHLGGLTTSVERDGYSFDNGQHVFLGCCSAYRSLLERAGLSEHVYLQPRLDMPVVAPGGVRGAIRRSALPAPLHLAGSLLSYRLLSWRERLSLLPAVISLSRLKLGDPALDTLTFGSWLRRHHQSDRAIARLWNLIVLPTLNVGVDEASLALAAQVFQVGFLSANDGADVGWSRVPLIQLHGTELARALSDAGVEVRLNTNVHSLQPRARGGVSIVANEETLTADAVVVATPARVAASLGVLDSDRAASLGASPIVNVQFVFDRKVTDLDMAACVDSPVEFIFDRSDAAGTRSGQCLVVSLSGASHYMGVGSSELIPQFLDALAELFPLVREAHVLSAVVTREATATFLAAPGVEGIRAGIASQMPGVLVAGAWCDTGWPATMEGAVRSGAEAASGVLSLFSDTIREQPSKRESVTS